MERPSKRPRLSQPDSPDDCELQEARARNNLRLKSLFEGIFEKYGRDFSDVGDEIDLKTGEIIVNKGHLLAMQHEDDLGEGVPQSMQDQRDSFNQSRGPSPESAGRINGIVGLGENATTGKAVFDSLIAGKVDQGSGIDYPSDADDDRSSVDSLLGDAVAVSDQHSRPLPDQPKAVLKSPFLRDPQTSTNDLKERGRPLEPLWEVPDIDVKFSTPNKNTNLLGPELAISQVRSASPPNAGSLWALPSSGRRRNTDVQKKRKSLGARAKRKPKLPIVRDWSFAQLQDGSDSDDPLQEDFPSSVSKSVSSFRSPRDVSVPPTPSKGKTDRIHEAEAKDQVIDDLDNTYQSDIRSSSDGEDTPISSLRQESTSIMNMGKLDQNGTGANEKEMSLLTSDDVKDECGLSWKDNQAESRSLSQEEIAHQSPRLGAGNEICGAEKRHSSQHVDDPTIVPDNDQVPRRSIQGPALQTNFSTPRKLKYDATSENLLPEDPDDIHTDSGISSIQIEARPYGGTPGSRGRSPLRPSVSPLGKYSSGRLRSN
jgi:hypothetical protein